MPQRDLYDNVILKRIENNEIRVDKIKGLVYGIKRDYLGNRIAIGYKTKQGYYLFSFIYERKSCQYFVSRAIYLSHYKYIEKGYVVYNKDDNQNNNSLENLDLKISNRRYNSKVKFWNKKDEQFVIENFKKMSYKNIGKILGRSEKAIKHKVKNLSFEKGLNRRRWTKEEDKLLIKIYKTKKSIKEMEEIMNRTGNSIRLRASRLFKAYRNDSLLRDILSINNFYAASKGASQRGSLGMKCCLCDYAKYMHLHHIDFNRSNNHISNISTLCPNHHMEVSHGEHKDKRLYAIWWRIYKDGSIGKIKNNLDYIDSNK